MQPSKKEMEAIERQRDSIRLEKLKNKEPLEEISKDIDDNQNISSENFVKEEIENKAEILTLENEFLKLGISTIGGKLSLVELKKFKTHDKNPLILLDEQNSQFGLSFFANNQGINTENLLFTKEQIDEKTIRLKKHFDQGYIEYLYHLPNESYMLEFSINLVNMDKVISQNTRAINLNWQTSLKGQEKGRSFENQQTNLYIKHLDDDVDKITKEKTIPTLVKWIGFKQQFFSAVLISDKGFKGVLLNAENIEDENNPYLKNFYAKMSLPYRRNTQKLYEMSFYFGPNHFLTLRKYGKDIDLHRLINLGWGIFGWINRYLVIPIFNFLENNISLTNYGVIILLLTIIIKIILFPLTYKSYVSQAKMRALKPQIDKINERIPKEKMMERQKATMDLYKKTGVSPMGGCLPLFIQFPILIAMFRFFPASIELRQKSFLWAEDLSTYDSIASIPEIPFFGDHISLFCLLMAVTNFIYTHFNMKLTASSSPQMPGMKLMMYMMPIMLLVWFNNYSSGLSYYYFISTLITVLQTLIIRKTIDDKKVLAKIEARKKKPMKKSRFQERLEKMAKERGYKTPKRKK